MCQPKVCEHVLLQGRREDDVAWLDILVNHFEGMEFGQAELEILFITSIILPFTEWLAELHLELDAVIEADQVIAMREDDLRAHLEHRADLIDGILPDGCFDFRAEGTIVPVSQGRENVLRGMGVEHDLFDRHLLTLHFDLLDNSEGTETDA